MAELVEHRKHFAFVIAIRCKYGRVAEHFLITDRLGQVYIKINWKV